MLYCKHDYFFSKKVQWICLISCENFRKLITWGRHVFLQDFKVLAHKVSVSKKTCSSKTVFVLAIKCKLNVWHRRHSNIGLPTLPRDYRVTTSFGGNGFTWTYQYSISLYLQFDNNAVLLFLNIIDHKLQTD